jgi:hypothetical protein
MATTLPPRREPVASDDDLSVLRAFQLDALDRLQTDSSTYVTRITECVSFLHPGGQQCEREVQLRLPTPAGSHDPDRNASDRLYVVSLGTFRRTRFPDFAVTMQDGSRCHLLSRRQHGHCLATCLLRSFFYDEEWPGLDQSTLRELHQYLAGMITTMAPSGRYRAVEASRRLRDLMVASEITDVTRLTAASKMLATHCKVLEAQTQYLCWVRGYPGEMVCLQATYTQADSPVFHHEDESLAQTSSALRLWWRNRRMREYARFNVFPFRYTFNAPAYMDCQSYYFSITPPGETRVVLLDWGSGGRYRTTAPSAYWGRPSKSPEPVTPPDGAASEVDSARFSYHFHNRRTQRKAIGPDSRRADRSVFARIHAFLRPDPEDAAKLAAVGALGLGLAILGERGTLFRTYSGGNSQWLLLVPAALVIYIGQQRRHHYARFTRRYRFWLWAYTFFAMLFAGSVAFSAPSSPILEDSSASVPRSLSAAFAIASAALIVSARWRGRHFERAARKRHVRINHRVRVFGTPELVEVICRFRWRRRYWRRPTRPIELKPDPRPNHPSDRVYSAIARHSIDRVMLATVGLCVLAACAMALHFRGWHWGLGEACAISRQHAQQIAAEEGRPMGRGDCRSGIWVPRRQPETR